MSSEPAWPGEGGDRPGDEVPCTALDARDLDERNPLMIPPCACPRCTGGGPQLDARADAERWLRVSGSRQRLRVERLTLGAGGEAMLG